MKLFKVKNLDGGGYDTYIAMVVAAVSGARARRMAPSTGRHMTNGSWDAHYNTWASSSKRVSVKYIGEARRGQKSGVILTSFCAG